MTVKGALNQLSPNSKISRFVNQRTHTDATGPFDIAHNFYRAVLVVTIYSLRIRYIKLSINSNANVPKYLCILREKQVQIIFSRKASIGN